MSVTITSQYANLSRGRITAKHIASGTWAKRGNGTVTLETDGRYMLSTTDGFNRKETVYVEVENGVLTEAFGSRSVFKIK